MVAATQDLPRPGGFPEIPIARNLPARGPSGATLFLLGAVVIGAGMYRVIQGIDRRRNFKTEKLNSRKAMLPFLQAELDRAHIRAEMTAAVREQKIMSDVPGWVVGESVYSTARYVPPQEGAKFGATV